MSLGTDPQPVRVRIVDGATGGKELLVADEALPMIHRYTLGATGAVDTGTPLATGVPITDFAVTALVPPTFVADPAAQPAATER